MPKMTKNYELCVFWRSEGWFAQNVEVIVLMFKWYRKRSYLPNTVAFSGGFVLVGGGFQLNGVVLLYLH